MFETIVLRRSADGYPVSKGQLAEAMLYYQNVEMLFDEHTLTHLLQSVGPELMISMLKRGGVSSTFCDEVTGIYSDGPDVARTHNFIAFNTGEKPNGNRLISVSDRIEYRLQKGGFSNKQASVFTQKFLELSKVTKYSGNNYIKGGLVNKAYKDVQDAEFSFLAAKRVIESMAVGYKLPDNFSFEIINTKLGNFVFTNADFVSINRLIQEKNPLSEECNPALVLGSIFDASTDLVLASFYNGDFATSERTSSIINLKHDNILKATGLNIEEKQEFNEIVLPNAPSLAEVIDSGERSIEEFLKLMDKSRRFKDWLHKTSPDENLVVGYLEDVKKEGWINSIPAKSIRYMFCAAVGVKYPAFGVAAGLADAFVVDKLFAGWRPNHFIDQKLKPFIVKN